MKSRALFLGPLVIAFAVSACARRDAGASPAFESRAPMSVLDSAHTAPVGRELGVRLERPIGTDVTYAGDFFTGRLVAPLLATDGGLLVPEGAVVHGTVAGVTLRPPSITLRFDSLHAGGADVPLDAAILSVGDGDVALKDALNTVDEARFSTLMRKIDVGSVPPPVETAPSDASREQLRIPAGRVVNLMLTSPVVVSRR